MAARKHRKSNTYDPAEALRLLPLPVLVLDHAGVVVFANDSAGVLLGCSDAPATALTHLFRICGVEASEWSSDVAAPTRKLTLSDGRVLRMSSRQLEQAFEVLTLEDVTQYRRESELARTDPMTNLANRFAYQDALDAFLVTGTPVAVFLLDLDRFKNVNDTLGHAIGDLLLRKVADRLESLAGDGCVVARLGGDEFVLLVPSITQLAQTETLAARIVDLIGRAYAIEGHMINVGASVGVALGPIHGETAGVLMKNAELALYSSKADGRGRFSSFAPAMGARMQARRGIELNLRRALALRQFELFYQPQIDLETQAIVGFEALVRWHMNDGSSISPSTFIPIAEETGLIIPIGEWVMRTACAAAAGWRCDASVAVNISPVQFRSGLVEMVVSALAHAGLAPSRLELEITEGALLDDTEAVLSILQHLRRLGVKVSMDDFGTGYSSLRYLQKFPFDKIKIDQSFVREMEHNEEAVAIVRAVATLGASLGIQTTAEGVETERQLAAIRAEGCSQVQGYLTGKPMPLSQVHALLSKPKNAKESPASDE